MNSITFLLLKYNFPIFWPDQVIGHLMNSDYSKIEDDLEDLDKENHEGELLK